MKKKTNPKSQYWDSITKEDLEFSVGSKQANWDVKDSLLYSTTADPIATTATTTPTTAPGSLDPRRRSSGGGGPTTTTSFDGTGTAIGASIINDSGSRSSLYQPHLQQYPLGNLSQHRLSQGQGHGHGYGHGSGYAHGHGHGYSASSSGYGRDY